MASEITAAPQQLPQPESMDTSSQEPSFEAPTVNGDHVPTNDSFKEDESSIVDVPAEAPTTSTETAIDTKVATSTTTDLHPAGPSPIENIASGIQPIADFIPKDASNLSHPTPPPDEPLTSGAADIDVEMDDAEVSAQPSAEPESVSAQPEPSLVRPREDDFEDEPAAKRSKVDDETQADVDASASPVDAPMADDPVEEATAPVPDPATAPSAEAPEESFLEPVEKSADEPVVEPSSAGFKVEDTQAETQPKTEPDTQPETQPETQPSDAPGDSVEGTEPSAQITESPIEEKPAVPDAATDTQPPSDAATVSETKPIYGTEPMTKAQKNSLVEKMKNLKKTKNSVAFLKPVDPVALNIPNYREIIKEPMDLGTMELKLKQDQYTSVQDFANDFNLIVNNSRRFNGEAHAVTVAALSMEAYFKKMMETVPTTDMAEPPKAQRKRSLSIPREKPVRRESRAAAAPAPAPPAAPTETYALQADGTPQIRRQSSMARPARAIKPPQNREIPYAKPKRKEHQLELKFCEYVLKEIRSAKHYQVNHVFQAPVDPVALNIPHYHQVIKAPMDMGTMSDKLKNGQYGTAVEFKKDFDLMIKNCLTFNPVGNPVRDLGISLQREFEALWAGKNKWERLNQPASNRASSASADDESGADEDDEDDEDPEDDKTATILALQKQLADMQSSIAAMAGPKSGKSKKAKTGKSSTKRVDAPAKAKVSSKPASRPKKSKLVTYDEKQEISEAVGRMDEKQVARLTEIITQNCAKYRDMEEMELEIDDLPNDVQVMLLEYVRRTFGNPNKKKARDPSPDDAAALDDDDFEPEKGARGNKRKKHRPMGKKEQQDTINNIKSKLAQFSQAATSGSESPTTESFIAGNAQADTSGDEESEESEEE